MRKKSLSIILLAVIFVIILNFILNFDVYNLKLELFTNWHYTNLPSKIDIVYTKNNRGGITNDGNTYTVIKYSSIFDLGDDCSSDVYNHSYYTYYVNKTSQISNTQLSYIENFLDDICVASDAYSINLNSISYLVEIKRVLNTTSKNDSEFFCDKLYILQCKEQNIIFAGNKTIITDYIR